MHEPTNHIDRLARRLLSEGYVDDEVEAYRIAISILMAAGPRRSGKPDTVHDDEPTAPW